MIPSSLQPRSGRISGTPLLLVLITLTSVPVAQAANLTWVGGFSGNWNFFGGAGISNWNAGQRPAGGDDVLTFPSGGANKTMNNDLTNNTPFLRFDFTGAGYVLNGNAFRFESSGASQPAINVTHGAGLTTLEPDMTLNASDTLTITASNTAAVLLIHGDLFGESGSATIVEGNGTVILDGNWNANVTLGTGLDTPTLVINGLMNRPLTVPTGATLAGYGAVGDGPTDTVTVVGDLSPGDPTETIANVATLSMAGNLILSNTANIYFDLRGSGPFGTDKLALSSAGTVTTNGARIHLVPLNTFNIGTFFTLIDNAGTDAINRTTPFRQPNGASINEGTIVTIGTNSFQFSYVGGDGNDLTLTVVPAASSGSREWDAGGATQLFSEATNWVGNGLPVATNTLIFGSLAPTVPLAERFPEDDLGGNFYKLQFTSGGYALSQSSTVFNMSLSAGITASHDTGIVNVDHNLSLAADQTFSLTGTGALRFGLSYGIALNNFTLTALNTDTGELRFNGPITGSGNFQKTGSGFVIMSGSSSNTYFGGTSVTEGELRLSRSSVNGAIPGALSIGGGVNSASVITTVTEQIADTAVVTVLANGSFQPGALETIGELILQGGAVSGTGVLAIAGNVTASESGVISAPVQITGAGTIRDWNVAALKTLTVSGALSVSPAATGITQRKIGPGTLVLSGTSTNTTISMEQGNLQLEINTGATLAVKLRGGTLSGSGRALAITSDAVPCSVSPGTGGGTALLECTQLALLPANNLILDLNGTAAGSGYDVVAVANTSPATVNLGNALLFLRQSAALPLGSLLTIIDNDGTDAVIGTFLNQPQGSIISSDFNHYTINYAGGTGNDVVLTAVAGPELTMTINALPKLDGGTVNLTTTKVGSSSSVTLVIGNTGTAVLNLTGTPPVQLTGIDASHFTISTQPAAAIGVGGTTTCILRFQPTSAGPKTASLVIPNNDTDEGPFNLTLQATALANLQITSFVATPPRPGFAGTINLSFTGSAPNTLMRLDASSNLTTWTTLRTLTTDSLGGATTGVIADPGNTNVPPRRYYRIALP